MGGIDRAVIFIDGNNWYHSLKNAKVVDLGRLDYVKIAQKLCGPRTWQESRYYIGQVSQVGNPKLYADQRSFLDRFRRADKRNTVHLGRLEPRQAKSEAATELLHYLHNLKTKIDPQVFKDLVNIGQRHQTTQVMVEKAVDVMLAVDLVAMAQQNQFETAYILSADGDYTHAVTIAKKCNKRVFAVSAGYGHQLASVVDRFIRIDSNWLAQCYT
jgi:uncharacterized LabA/DUF88 family protein